MSRILFDPETVQRLAAILKDTGLTELEMHEGESRLRLVRAPAPATALAVPSPAQVVINPAVPPVSPPTAGEEPAPPGAISSPMVGIAYLSSEPGAPPYIALGQAVTMGQTLLLIEAMKTFNQIKAPRAGTVTQILIASGSPVEYGQPLLVIA